MIRLTIHSGGGFDLLVEAADPDQLLKLSGPASALVAELRDKLPAPPRRCRCGMELETKTNEKSGAVSSRCPQWRWRDGNPTPEHDSVPISRGTRQPDPTPSGDDTDGHVYGGREPLSGGWGTVHGGSAGR